MGLKNLTVVSLVALAIIGLQECSAEEEFPANIPPIGRMQFMELCLKFNQTCAKYEVITEDGYILTVHRVRGDGKGPVLLWHGILDSSDTFIVRGPNSTSVALAAAGYDVWVGNSRGNKYSRRHISLDPDIDKKKFWDFSFHEIAVYDMSATIDFILENTGQNKLSAIGHSQGTTVFYILASTKPIYNNLVQPFISMAPIAFLHHIKPLFRNLIPQWVVVNWALQLSEIYEAMQDRSTANKIMQLICSQGDVGNKICDEDFVMASAGYDTEEMEPEFFRVIIGHFPAGTSAKDVTHFTQIFYRKRFANFDYGVEGNLERYGVAAPPDYDLKKVNTSVVLLCGANDRISTLEDVKMLRAGLPNVVHYRVMDRKQFNHLDFVWGRNINVYLNPMLKKLLNKYA